MTAADDRSTDLELRRVGYHHPDAQRLSEEVQQEYVARYGGRDDDPLDPAEFEPPAGLFVVAYRDGEAVATGGWRRVDLPALGAQRTAEIKRMYVTGAARNAGVARRVLAHLEHTARAAGLEALVLSTGLRQPEAIALYESSGYQTIPGFGYYAGARFNRCLAKRLD